MATQLDVPGRSRELARTLGEPPTKLYYHVNMLEEHGLLIVTGSQLVSGILEKRYQLVAASIGVDRALLTAGDTGVDEALHGILTTIFSTAGGGHPGRDPGRDRQPSMPAMKASASGSSSPRASTG